MTDDSAGNGEPSADASAERLWSRLAEWGYRGRIVSVQHLSELQEGIRNHWEEGLLDEEFFRTYLTYFDFHVPETLPDAQSIIVVAVPRPPAQVTFGWRGKRVALVIPPTYVRYRETRSDVERLVAETLGEEGYRTAPAALPVKLLAVRSGLAEYGRNNITYVSGMGSFLELVAVYSDFRCNVDGWRPLQIMPRCETCRACQHSCPTGAISSDRFLLRAERCLTFHNERRGDLPFPVWIDPSWHNCLIGCLRCQRVCPENRPFLTWREETEEFSEEETELLLSGQPLSGFPSRTLQKLRNLRLEDPDYLDALPRNLGILLAPRRDAGTERRRAVP